MLKLGPVDNPEYEVYKHNLKMYQGYLYQCIRVAKKEYYVNEFTKYKNDIRKTWDTLDGIICNNKMKSEYPRFSTDKGQQVTGDKNIADKFSKFSHKSDRVWQIQLISPIQQLLTLILKTKLFSISVQRCTECVSTIWNQNLARAMITFPPNHLDR